MKSSFFFLPLTGLFLFSMATACGDEPLAGDDPKDASAEAAPVAVDGEPPLTQPPAPAPAPRKLAISESHACVVLDGTVRCFGTNLYGQLAFADDPSTFQKERPSTTVPGIRDAVEVAVSNDQSCARHADGTVSCWGVDRYGGLGAPANEPCGHKNGERCRVEPQKVLGLTNAVKIVARSSHSCALIADGTMKCWGGTQENDAGPLRAVKFADGLVDIGFYRSPCGLTTKHDVLCFAPTDKERPKPLAASTKGPPFEGLTALPLEMGYFGNTAPILQRGGQITHKDATAPFGPVTRIASGGEYACALLDDGAVRCWGSPIGNVLGYVGPTRSVNGDADIALADAKRIDAPPATDISLSKYWGCALSGRTVTCWGAPRAVPATLRPGQGAARIYYDIPL